MAFWHQEERKSSHLLSVPFAFLLDATPRILCLPLRSYNLIHISQIILVLYIWNSVILLFRGCGHNKITFTSRSSPYSHLRHDTTSELQLCFCLGCKNEKLRHAPCECPCILDITWINNKYINVHVYVCRNHMYGWYIENQYLF